MIRADSEEVPEPEHRQNHCIALRLVWLEQNRAKASKWAKLARKGHDIAWEFEKPGGGYTGRVLIDGEIYTPREATHTFLNVQKPAQEQ